LPLGVLQRCQGRDPLVQFVPALPPWKLGAINRLKMGVWDKLALRFPPGTAFWGQNQIVRNTVPPSRFTIWFNPLPMLHKDILVPTVFGDLARRIEQTPPQRDADVVALLMNVIRGWFAPQNVRIPDPIDFQRSSWGTNPYAFGCYSHIPPGASGVDYDIMSLPVPFAIPSTRQQRLFFAGEATHRAHCSSVWGAYESGCREALRIACLLGPGSFAQNLIAIGRRKFFGGRLANCVQVWQEYEPQLRVLSTQLTPRRGRI
jgi:lysine-specific histone demethylase 1